MMSDTENSEQTQAQEMETFLLEKAKAKADEKRAARRKPVDMPLGITSLMDALTIILTYLLQSYGADPLNVNQKEGEMIIPRSLSTSNMADAVDVTVGQSGILVRTNGVANVKGGRVDASTKRDGPDGFFIDPLYKKLKEEAKKLKASEKSGGPKFQGLIFLCADKGIPYRLLAEVLYTANQAEFKTYTFAVTKIRE
jgi:hypothetical protein